jgi:cystathionine beta-lyase
MMRYNFDQPFNRLETESIKWRKFEPDVLPLWVADMDFQSPQPVIEALQKRVEHGIFGYPMELPGLREAFIDWVWQRYQWRVLPEAVIFMSGVARGFNQACHMFSNDEDGANPASVLVQPPLYPPMLKAPGNAGLKLREAPLRLSSEGHYGIEWDGFREAIDESTRLFLLCNPHNPLGRVFRKDELAHMAQICLQAGVLICSDEIHCDLTYEGHAHMPIAALDPEIAKKTITLMAPSKTFNLAGLQFSAAIIPDPELRQNFINARQGLGSSWQNLFGMTAALAAYRYGQEWLDQMLLYLEANRDFACEYIDSELPGISAVKPEGTYLLWLDCRQTKIPGDPCEFFIEKGRVALNDGATFGTEGQGFVRLNFGCPRATLEEALARMKSALSSL